MSSWNERAFDAVADLTKQILTLSTGVIALSFTFLNDLASGDSTDSRAWMLWSWVVFIGSIMAGIAVLMTSAGHQGKAARTGTATPDINAWNLRLFGALQIGLFVLGLALTGVAVALADAPPVVTQ